MYSLCIVPYRTDQRESAKSDHFKVINILVKKQISSNHFTALINFSLKKKFSKARERERIEGERSSGLRNREENSEF